MQNEGEPAFYYQIKKKNFLLCRKIKLQTSLSKTKLENLKKDCNIFSRLLFLVTVDKLTWNISLSIKKTNWSSVSQDATLNSGIKSVQMGILETFSDLLIHILTYLSLVGQHWLIQSQLVEQKYLMILQMMPYSQYSRVEFVFDVY